ncbi:magnesium/cobalt transporter CorA [Jiulongibacter sediminis]|jgi:magnesium transporter|uniref:magnesium/cobalt transporter CorA n=1 Tax=Jiulongibacter sediminis TaxID=1605367 RepID=UPI0026F126F6|nr:magnesium/cobalt transporter CorA [Jiulongibacter sediminis]
MGKKKNRLKTPKQKPFAAPGSLTYIGKEVFEKTLIQLTVYNQETCDLAMIQQLDDLKPDFNDRLSWLDVDGVHEPAVIEHIGKKYQLHPLLLEDVLNTTQKPKIELFEEENQLFVVLKMLHFDQENLEIEAEQISLILGKNFLVSFQEQDQTDIFVAIHERIKQATSRIRKFESDYLLYALIDLIVDHYYILLEKLTEKLETLEANVLNDPKAEHQNQIYNLKKEMAFMKRNILPLRDIIGTLIREDSELVGNKVNVYLRDVHDHVIQTLETLDSYREMADSIMNNYHASLSNKMNSVMKTLTVFTVLFMPLSFIAGLYGMNFVNMPELENPNGYFYALGAMALISIGLWFYFRWKKFV